MGLIYYAFKNACQYLNYRTFTFQIHFLNNFIKNFFNYFFHIISFFKNKAERLSQVFRQLSAYYMILEDQFQKINFFFSIKLVIYYKNQPNMFVRFVLLFLHIFQINKGQEKKQGIKIKRRYQSLQCNNLYHVTHTRELYV